MARHRSDGVLTVPRHQPQKPGGEMRRSLRTPPRPGAWIGAALISLSLSGCAAGLHMVPPDQAHVEFTGAELANDPKAAVRAYAARQNQEYLLFQGGGAQAEMIYNAMPLVQGVNGVAIDALQFYPFERDKRAAIWKINQSEPIEWGKRDTLVAQLDPLYGEQKVEYVPYTLTQSQRPCFSFESVWDQPAYDPDFSPRKVLFGYYCAPAGSALDKQQIAGVIESLQVRSTPHPLEDAQLPAGAAPPGDPGQVVAGLSPGTGTTRFPYLFQIVQGQFGGGDRDRR